MFICLFKGVKCFPVKVFLFIEKEAKKLAREVQETKIDVKMQPMSAFDRKTIHNVLSTFKNIKTESTGTEPNRCVVIKYKED